MICHTGETWFLASGPSSQLIDLTHLWFEVIYSQNR